MFDYSGEPITGIPYSAAPNLLNTSYTITADIDVPEGGGEGVIVTQGGRFGGYGLYLMKGKPVFTWNLLDLKRVKWQASDALSPGKHTLVYDFKYDGLGLVTLAFNNMSGIGRGGLGTLSVDGKVVATETMERTIPLTLPWDETFDIGSRRSGSVRLHRQDRQADDCGHPADADGGRQAEAAGGRERGAGRELSRPTTQVGLARTDLLRALGRGGVGHPRSRRERLVNEYRHNGRSRQLFLEVRDRHPIRSRRKLARGRDLPAQSRRDTGKPLAGGSNRTLRLYAPQRDALAGR